jgi:hypothetical protein
MPIAGVGYALERLRLAALVGTPDVDEAMIAAWAQDLSPFDIGTLEEVADAWIRENDRFPSLHQFLDRTKATARRRSAIQAGNAHGGVCPECGGDRFVDVGPQADNAVRPCSLCLPEGFSNWRENGHITRNPDVLATARDHAQRRAGRMPSSGPRPIGADLFRPPEDREEPIF